MAGKPGRRGFGALRKLPSKRWQASYAGPDGARHTAPSTFGAKLDAEAWLAAERRLTETGAWTPPRQRRHTAAVVFGDYANVWLDQRTLKPRTRALYRGLLDRLILPEFTATPLRALTPHTVRSWHNRIGTDHPTQRAHAYALLRTILGDAVRDGEIPANPCTIRGAGTTKRKRQVKPATLAELETITAAMPARWHLLVMLTAWCALRFGEATELRRADVDLRSRVLHVERGVTYVDGEFIVGEPKSAAGIRDVHIPPHLLPMVKEHLAGSITGGRRGLLFPAADGTSHLHHSTLYKSYDKARATAGRPDLRWHDLRHTGAVLAASTGATLAELMARLGHSTPAAALVYQHAAAERDKAIAQALSDLANREAK